MSTLPAPILSDSSDAQTVKRDTTGLLGLTTVGVVIPIGLLFCAIWKYHYDSPARRLESYHRRLEGLSGSLAIQQWGEKQQIAGITLLWREGHGHRVPADLNRRSYLLETVEKTHRYSPPFPP